jgi:hypothetical protein
MDSGKMYTHDRLSQFVDNYKEYVQKKKEEQQTKNGTTVSNYQYYHFEFNPNAVLISLLGRYSSDVLSQATFWKPMTFKNGIDGWKLSLAKGLNEYKTSEQSLFKSNSTPGLKFIINYDELPNGVYYGAVNIDIDQNAYTLRVASEYTDRGMDNSVLGTSYDFSSLDNSTNNLLYNQRGSMTYKLVTVDWYGLFYGETGTYQITCTSENCTFYIWYGDVAVCEYTQYNPIVNNNQTQSSPFHFSVNKYVPIRIQCYYYGNIQSAVSFNISVQKMTVNGTTRSFTDVPLQNVFFNSPTPPLVLYHSFVSLNALDFSNDAFQCVSMVDFVNDQMTVNDYAGLVVFYQLIRQYLSNATNGDYDYNNDNRLSYGVIPSINIEYTIQESDGFPFAYAIYKLDSDMRMGNTYQIDTNLNENLTYNMKEMSEETKNSLLSYSSNYTTYPGFYPNRNSLDVQYYNQSVSLNPNDCEQKCNENSSCNFYFTYKSLGNNQCVISTTNESPYFNRILPTNTQQPIDVGTSSLNMRNFQLNLNPVQQDCITIDSNSNGIIPVTNTSNYSTTFDYAAYNMDKDPIITDPAQMGICGDNTYKKLQNDAADLLFKDTTYYKDGTWIENFENPDPPSKYTDVIDDTSDAIRSNLHNEELYATKSEQINKNYRTLRDDKIPVYMFTRDIMKAEENNDYYGTELYFRKKRPKNLMEKKIADNNEQYLNTQLLYTLGTVSCATLIIFAIILARN